MQSWRRNSRCPAETRKYDCFGGVVARTVDWLYLWTAGIPWSSFGWDWIFVGVESQFLPHALNQIHLSRTFAFPLQWNKLYHRSNCDSPQYCEVCPSITCTLLNIRTNAHVYNQLIASQKVFPFHILWHIHCSRFSTNETHTQNPFTWWWRCSRVVYPFDFAGHNGRNRTKDWDVLSSKTMRLFRFNRWHWYRRIDRSYAWIAWNGIFFVNPPWTND
jgi:hypothetical protein